MAFSDDSAARLLAEVQATVDRAILAEREACARIAEAQAPHWEKNKDCGCGECVGTSTSAKAIRERGNSK